jgi:hypothetical protein
MLCSPTRAAQTRLVVAHQENGATELLRKSNRFPFSRAKLDKSVLAIEAPENFGIRVCHPD